MMNFLNADDSSANLIDVKDKVFGNMYWYRRKTIPQKFNEDIEVAQFIVDMASGKMLKCTRGQAQQIMRASRIVEFFNYTPKPDRRDLTSSRDTTIIGINNLVDQAELLSSIIDEPKELIEQIAEDPSAHYHEFTIPKKSGGRRKICAPNEDLKRIQRKILDIILVRCQGTAQAHGFVRRRSIKTNAQEHLGAKILIKMDMSNFFDTVNYQMVISALARHLPGEHVQCCGLIAKLCTLNNTTPQGCPTSPKITNLVAKKLDMSLYGLAKKHEAVYTRYADDICMSSKTNSELNMIIPIIDQIVRAYGFKVNRKKTGVFRSGGRLPVTGIVVNDILNVPRRKRLNLRAQMHHILTGRITPQEVEEQKLLEKIQGNVAFIAMANPQQGERFKALFQRVKEHLSN